MAADFNREDLRLKRKVEEDLEHPEDPSSAQPNSAPSSMWTSNTQSTMDIQPNFRVWPYNRYGQILDGNRILGPQCFPDVGLVIPGISRNSAIHRFNNLLLDGRHRTDHPYILLDM